MKKRKVKYTKKLHAHRLEVMLTKQGSCNLCPRNKSFDPREYKDEWITSAQECCIICQKFVGITYGCPCSMLGREEAIETTMRALKDYYA